MPLAGINVIHGKIITVGSNTDMFSEAVWSENLTTPGVTANSATERTFNDKDHYRSVFLIQAGTNAFVFVGPNPVAGSTPGRFVAAGAEILVSTDKGDKVRWVAA